MRQAVIGFTMAGAVAVGAQSTPRVSAIVNATLVPMSSDVLVPRHTLIVRGDSIAAIGRTGDLQVPADAEVVDARGAFVMPGLVDFHVHLRADSEVHEYLRHGVTTVVVMRATNVARDIRRRADAGLLKAPRILMSGPLLDGDPPTWSGPDTQVVRSAEEARAAVSAQCADGYEFLKTYNNLPADWLRPVVDRARSCGMPVVAHLPRRPVRADGLVRALQAGVDIVAHGEEIFFTHLGGASDAAIAAQQPVDEARVTDAVERISRAKATVIPNLSFIAMTAELLRDQERVFADPAFGRLDPVVQQMWRQQSPTRRQDVAAFVAREKAKRAAVVSLTRALDRAAVPLLLGTDASAPGMFPGQSAHVELHELVASGLSPVRALATATRNPGRFLEARVRRAARIGSIEVGRAADLLLLDANPLADVDAARAIRAVMVRGEWLVKN